MALAGQQAMREVVPPPQKDPSIMNRAASADHVAERYYGAARLCGPGQVVKFRDGTVWQEVQLYIKALELNPKFAAAYHNLAVALGHGGKVTLAGQERDQKQLYAKAIEVDPSLVPAYVNLAAAMAPGERTARVGSGGGGGADRCTLLLHALRLDPRCATAYLNLAACLPVNHTVQLPTGQMASAPTLVAMAQHLDPASFSMATPRRASRPHLLAPSFGSPRAGASPRPSAVAAATAAPAQASLLQQQQQQQQADPAPIPVVVCRPSRPSQSQQQLPTLLGSAGPAAMQTSAGDKRAPHKGLGNATAGASQTPPRGPIVGAARPVRVSM